MTILNDIKITNPTAEATAKKFSKKEISELFSTFLILISQENIVRKNKVQEEPQKTKWAEFAEKMDGFFTPDIVEHIETSHKKARGDFIADIG